MIYEPSLLPAINRNYGAGHPLKILRLDAAMERIRVDATADARLDGQNIDLPWMLAEIDASYLPLLEKYKRSDSLSVRYAADFASVRLGETPNIDLWVEALASPPGAPFRNIAAEVFGNFSQGIEKRGVEAETDQDLLQAALSPAPVDSRLLPRQLPLRPNVYKMRRLGRFAIVDVRFVSASGLESGNGYRMLFERRGARWVFVCVPVSFIS